jgi:hypothetical protein
MPRTLPQFNDLWAPNLKVSIAGYLELWIQTEPLPKNRSDELIAG